MLNFISALEIGWPVKLDQGALGMSDPCGTLQLALKPNSVSRINCLLSIFTFVLIDLLSPVKWPTGSHGVKG